MANIISISNSIIADDRVRHTYMGGNNLAELLKHADNTQETILQFNGEDAVFLSHYVAEVINDLIAFYNDDYKLAQAQTTLILDSQHIFDEDFAPEDFFIHVEYKS